MKNVVPVEVIENKIYVIRGLKVMLDRDLAELYGIDTSQLKRQVKRNLKRFPEDFMFVLSNQEIDLMVCQNVIPSKSYFGGALPYVFTEHGILMLSSVLNSQQAIDVNIAIMRTFTKLRFFMENNKVLAEKLKELESKVGTNTDDIKLIFETIKQMLAVPEKPKRGIGFLAL
ncbi:hypothetical protein A2526_03150 [candidate division WOR-1 bacterium RIFOXYD2_FULL_36_8]|uniref:KilA-N DNA-binding domain-containing protein n=1 Tax=candidate division WOR-1 bacterium RIFOXYB2_FULL_36_35 TaxID=1802578 RepID=A0A1F4S0M4_UNCSA|nr:MAG: hypothetical protein A2230_02460 [candidate division WOR-1 bacterium RIFOXYA2_FULL_36_21]OGC13995.1 MAG: hypothetical protein A2290_06485 [candidate division WOR-1 bacterium RIFOXYB2_FULL_36_35]OGC16554.1 MAG: hypothetical protein A2282_06320 [candidate division WOR-1 bacterium RIFOXYA12_FULL_36_13]OGC41299.1 MAG: hypothetical protein A2526_03150 [candidate division WOR-1 bacterium RIFOXYD2_FULL_36_8]